MPQLNVELVVHGKGGPRYIFWGLLCVSWLPPQVSGLFGLCKHAVKAVLGMSVDCSGFVSFVKQGEQFSVC